MCEAWDRVFSLSEGVSLVRNNAVYLALEWVITLFVWLQFGNVIRLWVCVTSDDGGE